MSNIVSVWGYVFNIGSQIWNFMVGNAMFAFIIAILVMPLLVKFYNRLKTVLH